MATTKKTTKKTAKAETAKAETAKAHVMSLKDAEKEIASCMLVGLNATKRKAELLSIIKECKLFEDVNCSSFKAYVNEYHHGDVYGVKYTMATMLIDCKNLVWCNEIFSDYGTHLATLLIKPLKNGKFDELKKLSDKKVIKATMSAKELATVLEKNGLKNPSREKVSSEAEKAESVKIDIEKAEKDMDIIYKYLETNKAPKNVMDAYVRIREALDI